MNHLPAEHSYTPYLPFLERRLVPLVITVTVILGFFIIVATMILQNDPLNPSISVQGSATIYAEPDLAEVRVGIQTGRQSTAQEAMQKLQKDMNAVLSAIEKIGIKEKDVRTNSFSLNPAYDWIDGEQMLRGYEAQQSISTTLRDLSKVGPVFTATTEAGANTVGGVSFRVEDFETLRSQAREKAIARAKQNAEELADQLGVTLGSIVGFEETSDSPPSLYNGKGEGGYGGGSAEMMSVPSGEQEFTLQVYLTYTLQ